MNSVSKTSYLRCSIWSFSLVQWPGHHQLVTGMSWSIIGGWSRGDFLFLLFVLTQNVVQLVKGFRATFWGIHGRRSCCWCCSSCRHCRCILPARMVMMPSNFVRRYRIELISTSAYAPNGGHRYISPGRFSGSCSTSTAAWGLLKLNGHLFIL